jgi:putative peptide zinc metalloprotease protein
MHKIMRHGVLRYGVVAALGIFAPLAVPGIASAGVSASPRPATYVNLARATSQRNFHHDFKLSYQLRQGAPTVLTANNQAVALTANCHDCGVLAIAFQVVFVNDQNLTAINAYNNANATSYSCVSCTNMAEAYQIVVATDKQTRLTPRQELGLDQVRTGLEILRSEWLRVSSDQIESQSEALATKAESIVANPDYPRASAGGSSAGASTASPVVSPAVSPAVNQAALPAQLTETPQPIVDLYVDVQVSS